MKRYWWWVIILLVSCVTVNLERKLSKDVKQWYEIHQFIMDTMPPKDVWDYKQTERMIFLTLPPEKQKEYIKMFWEYREIGMKEEYALRLAIAQKWFHGEGTDGYRTDRGKIMLICGQPDYIEFRDQNGDFYNEGDEVWTNVTNSGQRRFTIWLYWWGSGLFSNMIKITFEYLSNGTWEWKESMDKIDQNFMAYWRWRVAPTPDGWRMIRDFLGAT